MREFLDDELWESFLVICLCIACYFYVDKAYWLSIVLMVKLLLFNLLYSLDNPKYDSDCPIGQVLVGGNCKPPPPNVEYKVHKGHVELCGVHANWVRFSAGLIRVTISVHSGSVTVIGGKSLLRINSPNGCVFSKFRGDMHGTSFAVTGESESSCFSIEWSEKIKKNMNNNETRKPIL